MTTDVSTPRWRCDTCRTVYEGVDAKAAACTCEAAPTPARAEALAVLDQVHAEWTGTPAPATMTRVATLNDDILALSRWIDGSPAYANIAPETALWRRVAKVGAEAGEALDALGGAVGENPRKGTTHSMDDVAYELLDTAVAALGALAHMGGNEDFDAAARLAAHARTVCARAGLDTEAVVEPCPECAAGKHGNCDGTAWDRTADGPTRCPCAQAQHDMPEVAHG